MASKKDEAKAFKKLKETYSGAVKLSCNMWRYNEGDVSIVYQAYTDTPSPIVSDSFQDPMDAVDDLIKKVSEYENSTFLRFYKGVFNYQGEIQTIYCHDVSLLHAHKLFMRRMSKLYDRSLQHMLAYFDGSKDNYKITGEVDHD